MSYDELTDKELEHLVDALGVPLARIEAARARGFAVLERRAAARAPSGGATAAELEQRRRNARRARLAPSQAKRIAEVGRVAEDHAATGAALRSGSLHAEHARLIGGLLRRVPPGQRADLERRFVDLATSLDPVEFGRRARELLIRAQPEAADRVDRRAEERRALRATDTPDGGFAFSGELHGTAAETARVALQAFRRPDTADEHRSPEQRSADAFEQLCEAALRIGEAPNDHGVRPHVVVIIEEADLDRPTGLARLAHSGQPLPAAATRHLLSDATVSRLVRDATGTAIEASVGVRTVPMGLWRSLIDRDGGCTWPGCDAPVAWCDVAHGRIAFAEGGRLSPGNAALLCRRHHRRFDRGPFRMIIDGPNVRYERLSTAVSATEGSALLSDEPSAPRPGDPTEPQRARSRTSAASGATVRPPPRVGEGRAVSLFDDPVTVGGLDPP